MQYNKLGSYIKYRREKLDISLNSFAIQNEIDPAVLCRIENLKQNIKINVLEKIALGFELSPAKFLLEFEEYSHKNNL